MRKSLALCLLLAACDTATVPLASSQADAEGKAFAPPPPGQATLYVARGGDGGTLLNIAIGARQIGPLGNYTWLREDVPAGPVAVRCTGGESSHVLDLDLAPGQTTFLQVRPTIGWAAPRCSMWETDAAAGRQLVLGGKRARDFR